MVTSGAYTIELLGRHHKRSDFSCGVEPLDRYLREQATQDQRRLVAVPYVLVGTSKTAIVGYYTLSMTTIIPAALPEAVARKLPRYRAFPATLIGRLAVDRRWQGHGLGDVLLADALRRALHASKEVAAMAVVVDAQDDAACNFYARRGFTRLLDDAYHLYLPMETISRLRSALPEPQRST